MLPELASRVRGIGDALAGMPGPETAEQAMVLAQGTADPQSRAPKDLDKGTSFPGGSTPQGMMLQQVSIVDGIEVVPAAAAAVAIYGDVLADMPKGAVNIGNGLPVAGANYLAELLNNPTDGLNPMQFWMWAGRQRAAYEECFIAIERNQQGIPIRLIPAYAHGARSVAGGTVDRPGGRVVLSIPSEWSTGYGSVLVEYAIEDVLHVTGPTYDPFSGRVVRPLDGFARDAVGLHKAIVMRYIMRLMQGGHDNIVATMPERKSDYDAFMTRYKEEIAGIWGSGKPFPVPHGTTMSAISATDTERETVAMLNWMTLEIARGFRIPPHLLYVRMTEGVSARARSDLAEMFLSWLRLGLSQFVHSFTAEIDKKIVKPLANAGFVPAVGIRTDFDLDNLTQGTPAQRAEIAVKQRQAGVSRVDELRKTLKLPPLGGTAGEQLVHSIGAAPTGTGDATEASDVEDDEDVVRSE